MSKRNRGFTILELLIAMTAFTSMVLIASTTIIQIGRNYYRGLTAIKTQETSRSIVASLTESLQFTKGELNQTNPTAICAGNTRYTFAIDQMRGPVTQGTRNIPHVLWRDEFAASADGSCNPVDLSGSLTNGVDLVPENMRLTAFSVQQDLNGLVSIRVGVISGEDDLIENQGGNFTCRPVIVGSQYCAKSEIETNVFRRLE